MYYMSGLPRHWQCHPYNIQALLELSHHGPGSWQRVIKKTYNKSTVDTDFKKQYGLRKPRSEFQLHLLLP